MTANSSIRPIQHRILNFSPEALAQVEAGWDVVRQQFDAARDETTQRIRAVLANNPLGLPQVDGIDFGTESGGLIYASLLYATPADAAAAFDSPHLHPYVYLRSGTVPGEILNKAVQALDPSAIAAQVTNFGMSAIWVALSVLEAGDHIVVSDRLFGTTKAQLLKFPQKRNIGVTFVDGRDANAWKAAITPRTKAFFYEPVANPTGEVTNTAKLSRIARAKNILVIADTSATPLGNFLAQGADVLVPSMTKFAGWGNTSGGAVIVAQSALDKLDRLYPVDCSKHNPFIEAASPLGANQAPEVSLKLLERIAMAPTSHRRQIENARLLAEWIQSQYDLRVLSSALSHPGDSAVHSQIFALDFGTQEAAYAFAHRLGARNVNNFGGPVTTLTIPRSTTHKALSPEQLDVAGIGKGLVRLSAGIENVAYLKCELTAAFKAADIPEHTTGRRREQLSEPGFQGSFSGFTL